VRAEGGARISPGGPEIRGILSKLDSLPDEALRDRLDNLVHLPRRMPLPSQEEFQRLEDLTQVGLLLVRSRLDRPAGNRDFRIRARQRDCEGSMVRRPPRVRDESRAPS
jgi:hypothetical protein